MFRNGDKRVSLLMNFMLLGRHGCAHLFNLPEFLFNFKRKLPNDSVYPFALGDRRIVTAALTMKRNEMPMETLETIRQSLTSP